MLGSLGLEQPLLCEAKCVRNLRKGSEMSSGLSSGRILKSNTQPDVSTDALCRTAQHTLQLMLRNKLLCSYRASPRLCESADAASQLHPQDAVVLLMSWEQSYLQKRESDPPSARRRAVQPVRGGLMDGCNGAQQGGALCLCT